MLRATPLNTNVNVNTLNMYSTFNYTLSCHMTKYIFRYYRKDKQLTYLIFNIMKEKASRVKQNTNNPFFYILLFRVEKRPEKTY